MKDWSKEFDIREGTYTHSFRLFNPQDHCLGDTYHETEQTFVNISPHEDIPQIINTCIHESYHVALRREGDSLPGEVEHELIKRLFWAVSGLILTE